MYEIMYKMEHSAVSAAKDDISLKQNQAFAICQLIQK